MAGLNKSMRITIISSDQHIVDMTKGSLRFLGFSNILVVSHPSNALGFLLREKADMVITDFKTNRFSEQCLVKTIKSHPDVNRIIIVLFTGPDNTPEELKQMYREGISAMVSFPFKMNDLQKAIVDAVRSTTETVADTYARIRKLDFFSFMNDDEVLKLLKMCKCRNYKKGDAIFEEGQTGDRFYVIIDGTAGMYKELGHGQQELLAVRKEGECFGEMAILDNAPRSASARAEEDLLMFELDSHIMEGYEDIITLKLFKKITHVLSERLRDVDMKIKELALYAQDGP